MQAGYGDACGNPVPARSAVPRARKAGQPVSVILALSGGNAWFPGHVMAGRQGLK
jgi:hypothetical protein